MSEPGAGGTGPSVIGKFRQMLFRVGKEITTDELQDLKFLCRESIPEAESEGIDRCTSLFTLLEKKDLLSSSNLDLLLELLGLDGIRRMDLVNIVNEYKGSIFTRLIL